MKNYTTSSAGFDLAFPGPDSVEAYNAAGGDCLEDAINTIIYRSTLPSFWSHAIPYVEKEFSFPRGVDQKATEKAKENAKDVNKVKDVPEKFVSYFERLRASLVQANGGVETEESKAALAKLDSYVQQLALQFKIDPAPAARQSGPGKDNMAKAENLLAQGAEVYEPKITKIIEKIGGSFDLQRDPSGKPTQESVGWLIRAFVEQAQKEMLG